MLICAGVVSGRTEEGVNLAVADKYKIAHSDAFSQPPHVSKQGLLLMCLSFPSMHEPIIPKGARQSQSQLKRTCSIFAYEDIKEVHKRRYLLQVIKGTQLAGLKCHVNE